MTQHEKNFLFRIRLRASILSLLLFLIFLVPFFCVSDALPAATLDQFALSEDIICNPEYLKDILEKVYQASLDQGITNYDAYAYVLIQECYKAIDKKQYAAAIILSEYAEKISPDLPAATKTLAQAQWSRNKLYIHHLIAGYTIGFLKELKYLESLSAILASVVFSLVGAFFITFVFYSVSAAIKYAPLAYHDLSHFLPAVLPRAACMGWALIVFLLPLFLRVSLFWVLCYWLLLLLAYQNKKEQAITISFFILLAFTPWLLSVGSSSLVAPQIPLVKALWKANYEKGSDQETEYLKVYTGAHPEDAEAFFTLGLTHKKEKDYQGAEFYYQKALEIKPEYYNAHVNLGNVYCVTKKLDQAINEYNKAISLEPSSCTAHLNLSRTYLQKFMFKESEAEFMNARKLDRSLVDYFLTTYTEHPNRMVIDETLSRQVILDKAFSPPYEHRVLSLQLWDLLFRGMPLSYGWAAAVALIIGSLMLLKNNRFQNARSCVTCGKTFCKRCQRITAQGSSCRQCLNITDNNEELDPALREEKLLAIKKHLRRQTLITRFFTLVFPGAVFLWKGYLVAGVIFIFCFTFFSFKTLLGALGIECLWDFIVPASYNFFFISIACVIAFGCMLIKYGGGLKNANTHKTSAVHNIKRNP